MTIDEAILHAEEVADKCALTDGNIQCENDHRQLAEWLKDYKRLKEQETFCCGQQNIDAISRQAVIDIVNNPLNIRLDEIIKKLPSVDVPETNVGNMDCISRQAVLEVLKDKWNMFSDANDAMQESIDTIEALPSVKAEPNAGWIPVSERLPEDENKDYLVCCDDGYIATIMYDGFGKWLIDAEIIAWIPLPEPYTED